MVGAMMGAMLGAFSSSFRGAMSGDKASAKSGTCGSSCVRFASEGRSGRRARPTLITLTLAPGEQRRWGLESSHRFPTGVLPTGASWRPASCNVCAGKSSDASEPLVPVDEGALVESMLRMRPSRGMHLRAL